jgi:hypothetical protein
MEYSTRTPPNIITKLSFMVNLDWNRPVARELVHRADPTEVLVTDGHRVGPDRFRCAARWRRNHRTYAPNPGRRHSPLLVAETIRQACLFLSVEFLGVPQESHFVIKSLGFDIDQENEPRDDGDSTDLVLDVRVSKVRRDAGSGQLVALAMEAEYAAAGRPFAGASGAARIFDDRSYSALRTAGAGAEPRVQEQQLTRPAAGQVAVATADDVVVARTADGRWVVDPADTRHPFFFDHTVDHLPGMLLLEAARQHALLGLGDPHLRLTRLRMRPLRFAETAPPPHFEADAADEADAAGNGAGVRAFRLMQAGDCVLEGELGFSRAADSMCDAQ